ncbi:MAG: T9SS type A sorting domain-containing protein, partial [Saprospiraceae bacterium]|nr:T9SS type A sorting domain-containing protein [Saprospiraceae bacterium]
VYHVAVTYDGSLLALYLNGQLNSYKPLTGLIRTANLALLIGQMLPDIADYNFKGVVDDVKIFDYALTPEAVQTLYGNVPTAVNNLAAQIGKLLISPNPVGENLLVQLPVSLEESGKLSVYDLSGKLIKEQWIQPGAAAKFDTKNWQSGVYTVIFKSVAGFATAKFVKM